MTGTEMSCAKRVVEGPEFFLGAGCIRRVLDMTLHGLAYVLASVCVRTSGCICAIVCSRTLSILVADFVARRYYMIN